MELNLDFQLKSLDEKEMPGADFNAGRFLAHALYNSNTGHSLKFSDWSLKWYNKKGVTLDETDLQVLTEWIEQYGVNPQQGGLVIPNFTSGIKAQLLKAINDYKDALKNPDSGKKKK